MTSMAESPAVQENIFTAGENPCLLGGYCAVCEAYHFPAPEVCSGCLGEVELVSLGGKGTLYSITTIRTKPPLGLPKPYRVGYVDLQQVPLRIFALLDPVEEHNLVIGQTVQLEVARLGLNSENTPCLRPYFIAANT